MPSVKVLTAGGAANSSKPRKPTTQTVQNELDFAKQMEIEQSESAEDERADPLHSTTAYHDDPLYHQSHYSDDPNVKLSPEHPDIPQDIQAQHAPDIIWLAVCFVGIMASFVCYGLLLEYTTSGGRELHELSFLFVTSALYTLTAAAGRYVRDETPTTIPPGRFAVLGLTSMGSTFCSVRSLRYVAGLLCDIACFSRAFVSHTLSFVDMSFILFKC